MINEFNANLPYIYDTDVSFVIQWCGRHSENKAEYKNKFVPCGHSVYLCCDCFLALSSRVDYNVYFNALEAYLNDWCNRCPECQDRTICISSHCIPEGSWSTLSK